MHPPSVFLLDRGDPASETQAWDLPLPQLPHPLHRHSVPSWFWLSGLWSRLCPQSHHPTPSLLHLLRLCLAEKERVLHRGPAAGSLRYSRTAVCHQITEPYNDSVWASPVYWVNSRTVHTQIDLTGVIRNINSTCMLLLPRTHCETTRLTYSPDSFSGCSCLSMWFDVFVRHTQTLL